MKIYVHFVIFIVKKVCEARRVIFTNMYSDARLLSTPLDVPSMEPQSDPTASSCDHGSICEVMLPAAEVLEL